MMRDGNNSKVYNDPNGIYTRNHSDRPSVKKPRESGAIIYVNQKLNNINTNHILNTNNPHSVTKDQVGLGNVDNTSDANKPISDATQTALDNKQSKVSTMGSATKPVYVSGAGTFSEANTYAGGTKVTLNGSDKGADSASFYAPISGGTAGQYLVANSSGVPTWTGKGQVAEDNTGLVDGDAVYNAIISAISSVYKPAGSITEEQVVASDNPLLVAANYGNVYNVSGGFTTNTNFVEGSSTSHPAGTNVVVIKDPSDNTKYKFDVLAGFIDLSNYATVFSVNNKQDALKSFTNVSASSWVSDSTYADYGYKCVLSCTGITSSSVVHVVFGLAEAISGNYAPICSTDTNTVTIYSKVNTSITIPTIKEI